MIDDYDCKDSEDPGLEFIARQNLKTLNKDDVEPNEDSEKE
jgi:hypothetical protein